MNIREATAKLLKEEYGIDESVTALLFERHILFEPYARNALIRAEYYKQIKPKEKQRIKGRLAEKYYVSVELIEKMIKK